MTKHPLLQEKQRRHDARLRKICWDADVRQRRAGRLEGTFGRRLESAFELRYADDTFRAILHNLLQDWFHLMHRVVGATSYIHRKEVKVGGELGAQDEWKEVRAASGYDLACKAKLNYQIGIGSCWVRPAYDLYADGDATPVGLRVVTPDRLTVLKRPENHYEEAAIWEHLPDGKVVMWDLRDPNLPRYALYPSVFAAIHDSMAIEDLKGDEYDWFTPLGDPYIPGVRFLGPHLEEHPLPLDPHLEAGTVEVIMQMTWIEMCKHIRPVDIPVALTKGGGEVGGWSGITLSPDRALVLTNKSGGDVNLDKIPGSYVAVKAHRDELYRTIDELLRGYDGRLKGRRESGAEMSGIAIALESQRHEFREEQASRNRPADRKLLQYLVWEHNKLVQAGQLQGALLSDEITVSYPVIWTPQERKEEREALVKDIGLAMKSVVDLHLFDEQMEDTPENRAAMQARLGLISEGQSPISVPDEIRIWREKTGGPWIRSGSSREPSASSD